MNEQMEEVMRKLTQTGHKATWITLSQKKALLEHIRALEKTHNPNEALRAKVEQLTDELQLTDEGLKAAAEHIEAYRQALQFIADGHPHPASYAKLLLAIGKGC